MRRQYHFRADSVEVEWDEGQHPERGWIGVFEVAFRSKSKRKRGLFLLREWAEEAEIAHYAGPINARLYFESLGEDDAITSAVLTRHSLRVTLGEEAVAALEVAEVLVEFELDKTRFDHLHHELSQMLADFLSYREEIA